MLAFALLLGTAHAVEIGARAPELDITWARGVPQGAATTVYIHVATWCPVSRAVLGWLDDQADADLEVVGVGEQSADALRTWGDEQGWDHVSLGHSDTFRDAWLEGGLPLPLAVVVHEGEVVWTGRLASHDADLQQVLTVLEEDGPEALRARAEVQADLAIWAATVAATAQEGTLADLHAVLDSEPSRLSHPDRAAALNAAAWRLVTDEGRTPKDVKRGYKAARAALVAGGVHDAGVLDTYARALWERDKRDKAVEVQRAAVGLASDDQAAELVATLRTWEETLGLATDPRSIPPWSGTLNDAFDPGSALLVGPTESPWREELAQLAEGLHGGAEVVSPEQAERNGDRRLVLYGTPDDNALTASVLDHWGISLERDGVRVGDTLLRQDAPVLVAALPNPWRPELPIVVYTAADDEHAHHLNGMFHGPTAMVVGSWVDGRPTAEVSVDLRLEGSELVPAVGQARLTPVEAIADLEELHRLLRLRYAGYDDTDQALKRIGGSWEGRVRIFATRLRTKPLWDWSEVVDVLAEFLDPIQDTHFAFSGRGLTPDGGVATARGRLVETLQPWFADARLDADHRMQVGRKQWVEVDLPLVPGPSEVVPEQPYLFPTVDDKGAEAFLVGRFSTRAPQPIAIPREGDEPVTVELHRSRSALQQVGPDPWQLIEDGDIPVLEVRTMATSRVMDIIDTAPDLREAPRVVLDLRGNGGGADQKALDWTGAFSGQAWRFAGGGDLQTGPGPVADRWTSWNDRTWSTGDSPYTGSLYVLVDRGVASSGETFALLASQIPGAKVVGEPTAGCTMYGNVVTHPPLTHTQLVLRFGHTRFVWDEVRPVVEGVGLFPDLWLDEEDPIGFLAGLPQ